MAYIGLSRSSAASVAKRSPLSKSRLNDETNQSETLIAKLWEEWNTPGRRGDRDDQFYEAIAGSLPDGITERDLMVIASTIQWLATHCGSNFLREYHALLEEHGLTP